MISVLLVDNQPMFIEEAKRHLESQGNIQVTVAESGKKAGEILKKSSFDVIISEYQLPQINIIGLLETLRAHGDKTPVIIYATKANGDAAIKAMRGGAELFLRKSNDLEPQLAELKIIIEEIVKRRRIEDRLYRRERDFRTIVERNADAMIVIDRYGIIEYANPAALELFNLPEHEMIGKLLGSPIARHEPVDMDVIRGFREVAAAEMRMAEVEWEGKHSYLISFRDVSRHVKLEEELIKARDELETRVEERTSDLLAINDKLKREIEERMTVEEELKVEIEERSTAEEELTTELEQREKIEEALAEAKSHAELYLDLMGHDINNLNQIGIGYLEMAMESSDLETMRSLIEKPLEVLKSASQIIDNVRKIKKISEEGLRKDASLNVINLCDLLPELKERYSSRKGREIKINLIAPPLCFVKANDLIADVFSNLIENAIKHSPSQAALEINIRLERVKEKGKEYYLCSIEDNGPGIPDWIKDKLFIRLQRGDTTAHGRGLGLYLVKMLIESYHGAIWVEDRVSGDYTKGARFVVMLPAVR
jgi:signal transduction histidine kinase